MYMPPVERLLAKSRRVGPLPSISRTWTGRRNLMRRSLMTRTKVGTIVKSGRGGARRWVGAVFGSRNSEIDLHPQLDHAAGREAEVVAGGARVPGDDDEQRLAPARHPRLAAGEDGLPPEEEAGGAGVRLQT